MYDNQIAADPQATTAASAGILLVLLAVLAVITIIGIIANWRIFTKAKQAGWKSIIPIYNYIILFKIIDRPWWFLLLLFTPVNFVILIIIALDLAKSFGKSEVFGIVGLILFAPIGFLMLAFGKAEYVGPRGIASTQAGNNPDTPSSAPTPPDANPPVAPTPPDANPPVAPTPPVAPSPPAGV